MLLFSSMIVVIYVSKGVNEVTPFVIEFPPLLSFILIILLPPVFSIRVASFLFIDDYPAVLESKNDYMESFSVSRLLVLFTVYSIYVVWCIVVIEANRSHKNTQRYFRVQPSN